MNSSKRSLPLFWGWVRKLRIVWLCFPWTNWIWVRSIHIYSPLTYLVPVDTHVFQIGQRYLPSLSGMKSVNKTTYSVIGNFFRDSFGDLAGWAHTILFAAELPAFITPDGARKRKDTEKRTKTNKGPIKKESRSSHKEVKSVKRKHRGEEEKEETASRRYPKRACTIANTSLRKRQ